MQYKQEAGHPQSLVNMCQVYLPIKSPHSVDYFSKL